MSVVTVATLRAAVRALIEHHAGLRLSFCESDGRWQQRYQPLASDNCFEVVDLGAEVDLAEAITRTADHVQCSLTLQHPFRAVWLNLGSQRRARLFLVAHRLIVDGVSWRILLEDLQSAYIQLRDTGTVTLPARTTSLYRWSRVLQSYASSTALQQELPYWTSPRR